MTKNILVTDTLFIAEEHIKQLEEAGFVIERLTNFNTPEDQLCEVIRGKHGYILGGIEKVTERVINATDVLEAIAFTGSGYSEFIPAHREATLKGIAISATPGENAESVAEYTLALILAMVRNLPALTTRGGKDFYIARELGTLALGVVGLGHIGYKVAEKAHLLGMRVLATSRSQPKHLSPWIEYVSLNDLLSISDIVSLHVNKVNGTNLIGEVELSKMREGTILINAAFAEAVDSEALHKELSNRRLRAAFDHPAHGDFSDIDSHYYLSSNAQTGFNTREANKRTSDRVTNTIINLLTSGQDPDLVNPEYLTYR